MGNLPNTAISIRDSITKRNFRRDRIWRFCAEAKWEQAREAIPSATQEQIEFVGGMFKGKHKKKVTALHLACGRNGPADIVQMLVDRGADAGKQADEEFTKYDVPTAETNYFGQIYVYRADFALHDAIRAQCPKEVIRLLLERWPKSTDAQGNGEDRPLQLAVMEGSSVEILSMLLDFGADINTVSEPYKNWNGQYEVSSFYIACVQGRDIRTIQFLFDRGAKPDIVSGGDSMLLIHMCRSLGNDTKCLPHIKLILDHGANVNTKTKDGSTALIVAIQNQATADLIRMLMTYGADVNAENKNGSTALIEAINKNSSMDIVQLLLEHGADENKKDKISGKNAMEMACAKDRSAMIDFFEHYLGHSSAFVLELFTRAKISSEQQQRAYSRILKLEGIDRLEVLVKATPEGLKASGIKLGDAIAILEAARVMQSKDDIPFAEEIN